MAKNILKMPAPAANSELGRTLRVRFEDVTPPMAMEWLRHNHPKNRALDRSLVWQYADAMSSGQWNISDQAVSFDVEGYLVNGQHRLHAVIQSGKTVRLAVMQGLPHDAILTLDGGKKRTAGVVFKMAGREHPSQCEHTVRRVLAGFNYDRGRSYGPCAVDAFMLRHGEHVRLAHGELPKGPFGCSHVRAVVVRAGICGLGRDRLTRFAKVLRSGLMEPGEACAVLLRNWLLENDLSGGIKVRTAAYRVAERALTGFLTGEAVTSVRPAERELFPLPGEKE